MPYAPPTQAVPTIVTPPESSLQSESIPLADSIEKLSWPPRSQLRHWRYIVLHHTATDSGNVDSIDRTHRDRTDADGNPWRGIGYHFVIGNGNGMSDGDVQPTFRWLDQSAGAHAGNLEYNSFGIGVCLVGNFEEHPPTTAQIEAAKQLVAELKSVLGISSSAVLRHGDIKATECPGRLFPHEEIAHAARAGS